MGKDKWTEPKVDTVDKPGAETPPPPPPDDGGNGDNGG